MPDSKVTTVLIFPCDSEIALEMYRSIDKSIHFKSIGATSNTDGVGQQVFNTVITEVPYITSPDCIEALNRLIITHKIDLILPAHDSVCLALSKAEHEKKLKAQVVGPSYKASKLCRSKKQTYLLFKDQLPTPSVYDRVPKEGYPYFLKPDVGQGSKGVLLAQSPEVAKAAMQKNPGLLLMDYLPGDEYTVDCFTDYTGQLKVVKGRARVQTTNGISSQTVSVHNSDFEKMATSISKTLSLNGAWFFQVKKDKNNQLVLLEIATRIAGSSGLLRLSGINLTLLNLFNHLKMKVGILENDYGLKLYRALDIKCKLSIPCKNVYVDLDDTLICDNKVNITLVGFLYNCVNFNKKIHLITRHTKSLQDTLTKHRIAGLFDSIIHIQDGQKKSSFITTEQAIFIDDSFAERKDVSLTKNIPVFDAHMIEALSGIV